MKIVVAIDGSQYSQSALEACAARKWPAGSEMRLVHVAGPSDDDLVAGIFSILGLANTDEDIIKAAEAALENISIGLASKLPDVSVRAELLLGEPVKVLVAYASAFGANLIITGTSDNGTWEGFFLGSVSQGLLEQAACPVLVARASAPVPEASRPEQVLICVDDSACSGATVEWMISQPWLQGCRVCFVSVTDQRPEPGLTEDSQATATQLLSWQSSKVFAEQLAHEWAVLLQDESRIDEVYSGVVEGNPADLIVKVAKNWPADLVVVGSHGNTGLAKLVLGSVSQAVTRRAHCSVEVVRGIESRYYREIRAKATRENPLSDILASQGHVSQGQESKRGRISVHSMPASLLM